MTETGALRALRQSASRHARGLLRRLRFGARLRRPDKQCAPDFVIIGAQRSGTTFLYKLLTSHPNVLRPARKEIDYFTSNYDESLDWYKAHFPSIGRKHRLEDKTGARVVTGEASPNYLFYPLAAERLHREYPRARIISVLREPTERAISHYFFSYNWRYETLPIEEAMAREDERLEGEEEKMRSVPGYSSFNFQNLSYATRGLYPRQLNRWRRLFPEDRILILDSGALFAEPQAVLDRISDFLAIPRRTLALPEPANVGERSDVPRQVVDALKRKFRAANDELFVQTGIDFRYD